MTGAINYAMTDIYGGYAGTTETTVPDEHDQKVLVDEGKQTSDIAAVKKSMPVYLALVLIGILAVIMGVLK